MVEKKKAPRCQGKRRQFRGPTYGTFKCMKQATGTVETRVGFTEHHNCCDSDECYRSLAQGYPASFTPFKVTPWATRGRRGWPS